MRVRQRLETGGCFDEAMAGRIWLLDQGNRAAGGLRPPAAFSFWARDRLMPVESLGEVLVVHPPAPNHLELNAACLQDGGAHYRSVL